MPAPPAKKKKETTTISMVVEEWKEGQTEQFSAVQRIKGYPWRLRVFKCSRSDTERDNRRGSCECKIELISDMSKETNLWMCTVTQTIRGCSRHFYFKSWDLNSHVVTLSTERHKHHVLNSAKPVLKFELELDGDGERWKRRPTLDSIELLDGILVIGKEKKKINVNKGSLASLSSFFDRLFFGDFKEKDMKEITIGDVEHEEFSNLLKIVYGLEGISLTDENVLKVLQLADRFDIKIVEDACINFLLSKSSSLSIHQKLLFAEDNNLPFLKDMIISRYTLRRLRVLIESPEWDDLSKKTTKALTKRIVRSRSGSNCSEPDSSESDTSESDSSDSDSD